MLILGEINSLVVFEKLPFGVTLVEQSSDQNDPNPATVLFKTDEVSDLEVGTTVNVFVYTSPDGQISASQAISKIRINEFKPLTVTGSSEYGYFADWGLEQDLYIPKRYAHCELQQGFSYVTTLLVNKQGRLIGTTKIEKLLERRVSYRIGQACDLLVYDSTPLGYKAVIDDSTTGLIYKSDVSQAITIGQQLKGFIKAVRNDDKIDLTLTAIDSKGRDNLQEQIIENLEEHDGILTVTDKSTPEEIFAVFKVSKGSYKRAIGALYKQKRILIEKNLIRLNPRNSD